MREFKAADNPQRAPLASDDAVERYVVVYYICGIGGDDSCGAADGLASVGCRRDGVTGVRASRSQLTDSPRSAPPHRPTQPATHSQCIANAPAKNVKQKEMRI